METRDALRYHLLRPLLVRRHGDSVPLGGPKPRSVLAALLLDANRVVPEERLIGLVWGDRFPASVRNQIQVHISGLRKAVGATTIRRSATGYQIEVRPGELDLHEFEQLVVRARADAAAGRMEPAARQLREALAMWPGPALDGVTDRLLAEAGPSLAERRLAAREELYEVELALGRHPDLVGELLQAVRENPLRERTHAQLMLALHRSGRTAEALDVFAGLRDRLVGELGVEPGQLLQDAQRRVLRGETGYERTASVAVPPPREGSVGAALSVPVPQQLPADVPAFAGRGPETSGLDALLARPSRPTVVMVVGMAGVGKTTFAVHWAHRVRDRFPDGQLYANLGGFAEDRSAVPPAQVIRAFLDALGVPPARIPADPDAQAGLYRSLLAGRRMLIVLDNARDAAQVRPLLPGSPHSLTLVTSRDQLASLVVGAAAHPIALDLLSEAEARELLAHRLGTQRLAAEPEAVSELITGCARLPLALAIVAARAAMRPGFPLASLADQLRTTPERLDVLAAGDAATRVRSVFGWSCRTLSPAAARLFRLLGLHPGPDIGVAAVAGLGGVAPDRLRPVLDELTAAHLVTEPVPGRYALHDLLRDYAADLARTLEPEPQLWSARHRMLDHYLHTAHRAAVLVEPGRRPIALPEPVAASGVASPAAAPGSEAEADAWFVSEHRVLLAMVELAAAAGFDAHAWRLAWTLVSFADRRGYWRELAAAARIGLAAATRLGDRTGQAGAHRSLACALFGQGDYDRAGGELAAALACYRELDDRTGYAEAARNLALVLARQGRYEEALAQVRRALEQYPVDAHERGRARMINDIGWLQARLGEHRQALGHCERALAMQQQLNDRAGEANTWDSLGFIHHRLGDCAEAAASYARALELFQALDDRYLAATTLTGLGEVHHSAGAHDAARQAWSRARKLLADLDHPDADAVQRRLAGLAAVGRAVAGSAAGR